MPTDPAVAYYHWPSYYLSRVNFVVVHIFTVAYWFPFLLNNPLKFPFVFSTLDSAEVLPAGQCTPIIWDNVKLDIALWLFWWGQHSIMSRKVFKELIGTWGSPFDRPLFGLASCIAISVWTIGWQPITNCERTDFTNLANFSLLRLAVNGTLVLVSVAFVLSYFWILPTHVFGTDHYRVLKESPKPKIITGYPYGIVRHPAAAAFLWLFWAWPSYTVNHIFYATLWSIFILVGTMFEEGGLNREDEFGKAYSKYSSQVSAFIPRLGYFTGKKIRLD